MMLSATENGITPPSERYRVLVPLMLLAALALASVPMLHPNNTCHDWLEKWGQLAGDPLWLPSHQAGTLGFILAGAAMFMVPMIGSRTMLSVSGGAVLGAGLSLQSVLVLLHATVVSRIGQAYNAATEESGRQTFRVMGEAVVNFDVAASGVAALLISAGALMMSAHLYRARQVSLPFAVILGGVGLIWGSQYFGLHRLLRLPTSEWLPYGSLACWVGGVGLALAFRGREANRESASKTASTASAVEA